MDQINKALLNQLTQKIGVMKGMQMSGEEIEKSFDKSELDPIDDIKKSKSFPVGTIHNGFKKVGEGKWMKVTSQGKTRQELKEEIINRKNNPEGAALLKRITRKREAEFQSLDDKEYSDEDVHGSEKKDAFSVSLDKSGRPEFGEYTRPNYVEITLSGGKKIKFSEKRNIAGGQKMYQSILQGLDTYHENEKAKNFIDKLVAAAAKDLTSKD